MNTPPPDLSISTLRETLEQAWGIANPTLSYRALGFGSHHWQIDDADGTSWFASVDDHRNGRLGTTSEDSFDALDRAFQTATALRDRAQLGFVVAPIPDRQGHVLQHLGATSYSIALFPLLDVVPSNFGEFATEQDRLSALNLVGRIHQATASLQDHLPRQDDLAVPRREEFFATIADLDTPWDSGPYGEPTRLLIRTHRDEIITAFSRYDDLVSEVRADAGSWVITHGEPHAGNVVRNREGDQIVVDWDTVAFAPRERDLWTLLPNAASDWTPYRDITGVEVLSEAALSMYRLWWDLSEIGEYAIWFASTHTETEDTGIGWGGLQHSIQAIATK